MDTKDIFLNKILDNDEPSSSIVKIVQEEDYAIADGWFVKVFTNKYMYSAAVLFDGCEFKILGRRKTKRNVEF